MLGRVPAVTTRRIDSSGSVNSSTKTITDKMIKEMKARPDLYLGTSSPGLSDGDNALIDKALRANVKTLLMQTCCFKTAGSKEFKNFTAVFEKMERYLSAHQQPSTASVRLRNVLIEVMAEHKRNLTLSHEKPTTVAALSTAPGPPDYMRYNIKSVYEQSGLSGSRDSTRELAQKLMDVVKKYPSMTPNELKEMIQKTVHQKVVNSLHGKTKLDVYKALLKLMETPPSTKEGAVLCQVMRSFIPPSRLLEH